jgi:hypothetical protein
MKNVLLAAVLGLSLFAFGFHSAASSGSHQPGPSNVPSQARALRVNTPKANENISQTFVHVTYQLTNTGISAAASPTFTIQLDGNDPVNTTASDYTFTGLTPGAHTVTVTLADANGSPIAHSSVSTKFTVVDGTGIGHAPSASSFYFPNPNLRLNTREIAALSDGSTPLPMLSLVGFVVLIGGICTAVRVR